MRWFVNEMLGPVARRAGGQFAAALVAVGMAVEHEAAIAAVVAWAIVSAAEVLASSRNRKSIIAKVRRTGSAD